MKTGILLLLLVGCSTAPNQTIEKIIVNASDPVSGYYLAIKPAGDIRGVLVLLDGFGGRAEGIVPETKLPVTAAANNFLTIMLCMGQKIYADSQVTAKLNLLLKDVVKRFHVSTDQFLLGGFSAGGTIALRYTELCKESPELHPVLPRAVFAVDSPVDIIDLWYFFGKQVEKNYSTVAVQEAKLVSALMEREHGRPDSNLNRYRELTPFYFLQKGEGNERFLKDTPVRVYHDVDIAWQLKNRRRSAYEANFLNSSELILRLLMMKNEKAEFIKGRTGFRSNGTRHPHSWNIVDENEFVEWMKTIFET